MEVYSNEKEQENALRHFIVDNGKSLVIGVIIGVVALTGWRYWRHAQDGHIMETSAQYQRLFSLSNGEKSPSPDAIAAFVNKNNNTYGALAALELAKRYVSSGQLDNASLQLQNGLKATNDKNLQAVLRLRLARVQLQQKKADAAIKMLDEVKGDGWAAIVADIRGEALLSKGDKKGARAAWSKGIASEASPALKEMMQMKINNLG